MSKENTHSVSIPEDLASKREQLFRKLDKVRRESHNIEIELTETANRIIKELTKKYKFLIGKYVKVKNHATEIRGIFGGFEKPLTRWTSTDIGRVDMILYHPKKDGTKSKKRMMAYDLKIDGIESIEEIEFNQS